MKKQIATVAAKKEGRPFNMRSPAVVRQVIEMAARAVGESLTTYLLRSAVARAKVILTTETSLLDRAEEEIRYHGLRY